MKKLVFLIIIIVTVGLLPCWIQYGAFCLTTDFLNQQIGFIIETKKMLASGTPFWSWNTYFGQNFLASYSFYTVTSPFVWINCLFPVEYIMYSITFTLYLKMICMGLLTFMYFRKMQIEEHLATIGSLLFTFSSFVTISIGFYHFLEPIMCFPLLLWAIEKYIRNEKNSILFLGMSVFTVGFVNFYFIPCTLLPALIYLCCRLMSKNVRLTPKKICVGIITACLGLAVSSIILLPSILYMAGGERAQMGSIWNWAIADRIGSLFIPKVREGEIPLLSDTGWNSTAAYIAVLGILPALIYAWRKRNWLSAVLLILIICYLTPLNGLFSLFTDVYYTRWAYTLSFLIVTATVFFLKEKMIITRKHVIIFALVTISVCLYRYFWFIWKPLRGYSLTGEETGINTLTIACLLTSCLFLFVYYRKQNTKVLQMLIVIYSILQLCCFCFLRSDAYCILFNADHIKKDLYTTYIKNNSIEYQESQNTYRTDFITRTQPYYYANVCLLKNIPSVCTYNSVRSNRITKLCHCVDAKNTYHKNAFVKDCNQNSFDCLMSVRDIVHFKDPFTTTSFDIEGEPISETSDYTLYRAKYYIPFGFTYNRYILQEDVDKLIGQQSSIDISAIMLDNIAIKSEDEAELSDYLCHGVINYDTTLDIIYNERKQSTAFDTEWTTTGFSCKIAPSKQELLFFSVPAEKGFTATIDGRVTKIYEVNCGLSAILVSEGEHEVIFKYIPEGLYFGIILSIISTLILLIINYFDCKRRTIFNSIEK